MTYLPPFAVQGTHMLTDEALGRYGVLYGTLLGWLARGDFDVEAMGKFPFLNDWLIHEGALKEP